MLSALVASMSRRGMATTLALVMIRVCASMVLTGFCRSMVLVRGSLVFVPSPFVLPGSFMFPGPFMVVTGPFVLVPDLFMLRILVLFILFILSTLMSTLVSSLH